MAFAQHSWWGKWVLGIALMVAPVTHAYSADSAMLKAPGGISAEMRAGQTFSYDSNPLRSANHAQSLYGSTTSPQLIIRKKTALSIIEADTRIDANAFNRSAYNSVDVSENLYARTENERWQVSTRAVAERDTTRTSELTNYALNLPRVYRTRLGASPRVAFRSGPFDTWALGASTSHVMYDNRAYKDYAVYSLTPSYEHRFDAKNTGILSVTGQRYETNRGSAQRSDSIGPSVGFASTITPQLKTRLTAGAQSTEKSSAGARTTSTWNYVFAGSAIYAGSHDTIDFTATRAREPFGNGTETLLTSVSLKERHAINPALAGKLNVGVQDADYESAPGVNLDNGWNAGTGLSYTLHENLSLDVDYRYRSEKLTTIAHRVNQHIAMFSITYQPFWSRG